MSDSISEILAGNRRWAEQVRERDPGFFERLQAQQSPHYLWIGCADSRVPANEIVGMEPGEIFVHRNVANVVVHSDLNCLSVIEYAVKVLQVSHILVVGHYGCGGVKAALHDERVGLVENWVRHVQDVRNRNLPFFEGLAEDVRLSALCELNVLQQGLNVAQTTVVQDAWQGGQQVAVHALVYGLHNGLLQDLGLNATSLSLAEGAHRAATDAVRERYEAGVTPGAH